MTPPVDRPVIRLAPAVAVQLADQAPATILGVPARTLPGLPHDQLSLMSRTWFEQEAAAWARGHELGPLQLSTEQVGSGVRLTVSAELRRRTP